MIPKVVDTLMQMGMNRTVATMSIPAMWDSPSISDRYSSSRIAIVKALQSHYGLSPTGQLDRELGSILVRVCGANWRMQSWLTIYQKVLAGGRPQWQEETMSYDYGMGGDVTDVFGWGAPGTPSNPILLTYCSTSNVQGRCKPTPNMCKPMTRGVRDLYEELQRQLNRVAAKKGWARIATDGLLGVDTVELSSKAIGVSDCNHLAMNIMTHTKSAKSLADSLGAPTKVPAPPSTRPAPTVGPDGKLDYPDMPMSLLDSAQQFAMSPIGLFIIAGAAAWKFGLLDGVFGPPKKKAPKKKGKGLLADLGF